MKKLQRFDFSNFIVEYNEGRGYIWGLKVKERKRINLGKLSIIFGKSYVFGKILAISEKGTTAFQSSEKWSLYDEALAILALSYVENPKEVLLIGGGDLKIARKLIKWEKNLRITVVDPLVGRIGDKTENKEFVFVEKDATEALSDLKGKFDIVIGDLTDPEEDFMASKVYSEGFFEGIRRKLTSDGIFVIQAGSPVFQTDILERTIELMKTVFGSWAGVWFPAPLYPGGIWSAVLSSRREKPARILSGEFLNTKILHEILSFWTHYLEGGEDE